MARNQPAWGGNVVFADRFVRFSGRTGDNHLHCHLALQLVVAEACCVELADGKLITGSAIAIRPHVRHRLHPLSGGQVYLVDPYCDIGAALSALFPPGPAADVSHLADAALSVFDRCDDTVLDGRLDRALAILAGPQGFLQSIAGVARLADLSSSRLRALAQSQLAMPLGRWRRWSAMRRACEAIAGGQTPALAAAEAGFADQAHLTRTMRAMLGTTPAQIAAIRAG